MPETMTEDQLDTKYKAGVPHWRKDRIEKFICHEHRQTTYFVRDLDLYFHDDVSSCSASQKEKHALGS